MVWIIFFWLVGLTWWLVVIDNKQYEHSDKIKNLEESSETKYKFVTYNSKGQINKSL